MCGGAWVQALVEAYAADGWRGASRDKVKPLAEIKRAKEQVAAGGACGCWGAGGCWGVLEGRWGQVGSWVQVGRWVLVGRWREIQWAKEGVRRGYLPCRQGSIVRAGLPGERWGIHGRCRWPGGQGGGLELQGCIPAAWHSCSAFAVAVLHIG